MINPKNNYKDKKNFAPHKNVGMMDIIKNLDYPTLWSYIVSIAKAVIVIIAIMLITLAINPIVMRVAFFVLDKPMNSVVAEERVIENDFEEEI